MKFALLVVCLSVGVKSLNVDEDFYQDVLKAAERDFQLLDKNLRPLNFSTKCFPMFGCYSNGSPIVDPITHYQVYLLPEDDADKNIQYRLFTPHNQYDNYTLLMTKESLENSPFNVSAKTAIYIHGFKQDLDPSTLMYKMKDGLVSLRGYNFFIVDFMNYLPDSYLQALANGRVVATAAAKLIQFITNNTALTAADFHVIGHSLGGNIGSLIGRQTPGLGRLTVLEAGGIYLFPILMETIPDPSDALFVDVIHTNIGIEDGDALGIGPPIGHQDFYVNGGKAQPGCGHENHTASEIKNNGALLLSVNACDHMRSENYFVESILYPNCSFRGILCDNYDDWKKGTCQPPQYPIAVMGIDAKPIPGLPPRSKFYLDTNLRTPFCKETGYKPPRAWDNNMIGHVSSESAYCSSAGPTWESSYCDH